MNVTESPITRYNSSMIVYAEDRLEFLSALQKDEDYTDYSEELVQELIEQWQHSLTVFNNNRKTLAVFFRVAEGFKYVANDPSTDEGTVAKMINEFCAAMESIYPDVFIRQDFQSHIFDDNKRG